MHRLHIVSILALVACVNEGNFSPAIVVDPDPLVMPVHDGFGFAVLTVAVTGTEPVTIESIETVSPLPPALQWTVPVQLPATFEPGRMLQVRLFGDTTGWDGDIVRIEAWSSGDAAGCGVDAATVDVSREVAVVVADPLDGPTTDPLLCDVDADGYLGAQCGGDDCNDAAASVFPGAPERCNQVDDDCDDEVDEGTVDGLSGYADVDGDGFGDGELLEGCFAPEALAEVDGDCDDRDAGVNPAAAERCDGRDEDCDGAVDEDPVDGVLVAWPDDDEDGFGDELRRFELENPFCPRLGYVFVGGDCDDTDDGVNPDAAEVCDAIDNDCDGQVDDGASGVWTFDADGDGVGGALSQSFGCEEPGDGWVLIDGDCDDGDPSVFPGAPEQCDGLDQDCDTLIDEDVVDLVFRLDADGDGFGGLDEALDCVAPGPEWVLRGGDCADDDANVNPDADELCNEVDDDCDGETDEAPLDGALWYTDLDGDGFGGALDNEEPSCLVPGRVEVGGDCDDANRLRFPGAPELCNGLDDDCDAAVDEDVRDLTWYADLDGDGAGNPRVTLTQCGDPGPGWVLDPSDCDDTRSDVAPGLPELCDRLDNDCDGRVDDDVETLDWYADLDRDGWGAGDPLADCAPPGEDWTTVVGDCDDADPARSPDAAEVCDGVDNDCDGATDEGVGPFVGFVDLDGDGFGGEAVDSCEPVGDLVEVGGDCDDLDPTVFPDAAELCDGLDNDCDGAVDDDVVDVPWFADLDGDGFGDPTNAVLACASPGPEWVLVGADCDDDRNDVFPGAAESCDGVDQDCDGAVDEDPVDPDRGWLDDDGDGFGDPLAPVVACELPPGAVADDTDCDDARPDVFPGALEVCDGIDQDCDAAIDEGASGGPWYVDGDRDGFGLDAVDSCLQPPGTAPVGGDCDDADPSAFPGALEVCDGSDDDCDGAVDEAGAVGERRFYDDLDRDGFGAGAGVLACEGEGALVDGDCDDERADVYPDAPEACDGVDQDCDGAIDEGTGALWFVDGDVDGFGGEAVLACEQPPGTTPVGGDCDDDASDVFPGADEVCNLVDDDCDEAVDEEAVDAREAFVDLDLDGFGGPRVVSVCVVGPGFSEVDGDCDDADPDRNPDASEVCNGVDDDCDGGVDEDATDGVTWFVDGDRDGFGAAEVQACLQPPGTSPRGGDCADADNLTYPGAPELCDGVDNNCDGTVDDPRFWYRDSDGDTYGNPTFSVFAPICAPPVGFVPDDTDCNDAVATTFPGAPELCDNLDNDCDGVVDDGAATLTWYTDADNDGFGADASAARGCVQPPGTVLIGGDCDDARSSIRPGATETCDALDQDCDGQVDEGANVCPCPIEQFGGHAYAFCDAVPSIWVGAQLLCGASGYDLVSISDASENDFVWDGISRYDPGTDWWIGYADDAQEGRWVWEDGSVTGFVNWEPGQPNNFFDQDCGEIDPDNGQWNDESCIFALQPFVCESP